MIEAGGSITSGSPGSRSATSGGEPFLDCESLQHSLDLKYSHTLSSGILHYPKSLTPCRAAAMKNLNIVVAWHTGNPGNHGHN
jgi:hypothetical protein